MPAIGQDGVDAISLKPGGSSTTLSPWLILRIAKFTHLPAFDLATELLGHGLHAIADAKNRYTELEHCLRRTVGRLMMRRHVTARKNHATRGKLANKLIPHITGVDLAIDVGLANPPRDQLGDLRTKIEDEDAIVHGCLPVVSDHANRPSMPGMRPCYSTW